MILGIGTDIIEIDRVRSALEHVHFKNMVYTQIEQSYCENRGKNSAASYAARFAAKEAFFKALGTGIFTSLTDVEVQNDSSGQPKILLYGKAKTRAESLNVKRIFLSLSHSRDYATAFCLLETTTEEY